MRLISSVLLASLTPAAAFAQSSAPFKVVETNQSFAHLADAVRAIDGGDGTISIAPGRYQDCAVQEAGRIAFVAKTPGSVIFDGGICEGKATLVLRGRAAHVEGLTFIHDTVPDGNGAGIRIEKGNLVVVAVKFVDGQCGILSASDATGSILVDHSSFAGLGKHPDGNGAHSLYIGRYGSLKVINSRFERGTGGHYLKSRSAKVEIIDNSFDDSAGTDTNYMIDLPEGASGRIAGNTFVNGLGKENHSAFIAVTAEERVNSSADLVIEGNRASLSPGFAWSTVFVANWSNDAIVVRNNQVAAGIKLSERR